MALCFLLSKTFGRTSKWASSVRSYNGWSVYPELIGKGTYGVDFTSILRDGDGFGDGVDSRHLTRNFAHLVSLAVCHAERWYGNEDECT